MVVLAGANANTPDRRETGTEQDLSTRQDFQSRITARTRADVVELYCSGLSALDVSEQLSIGKTTVLKILKSQGVTVRPQGKRIT